MADILLLLVGAILVNNVVLTQYLGLSSLMGAGGSVQPALGMSALVVGVLTLSAGLNHLLYHYLLVPLELAYLRTLVFILVIALLVAGVDLVLRKREPLWHKRLGTQLPLVAANSAILGVTLLNSERIDNFFIALLSGFGAAVGFGLVLILFAALRERLMLAAIPRAFQGSAISLVTAGLMALAFMGFAGLV